MCVVCWIGNPRFFAKCFYLFLSLSIWRLVIYQKVEMIQPFFIFGVSLGGTGVRVGGYATVGPSVWGFRYEWRGKNGLDKRWSCHGAFLGLFDTYESFMYQVFLFVGEVFFSFLFGVL